MTDELHIDFAGSLRHFSQLSSLRLNVYTDNRHGPANLDHAWRFIATFLSTASPNPSLKGLSIHFPNLVIESWEEIVDLMNSNGGGEFVLRNAEALDLILLGNSFGGLLTLDLGILFNWQLEFPHDTEVADHILTELSHSVIEDALQMKLPRVYKMIDVTVSVEHLIF